MLRPRVSKDLGFRKGPLVALNQDCAGKPMPNAGVAQLNLSLFGSSDALQGGFRCRPQCRVCAHMAGILRSVPRLAVTAAVATATGAMTNISTGFLPHPHKRVCRIAFRLAILAYLPIYIERPSHLYRVAFHDCQSWCAVVPTSYLLSTRTGSLATGACIL